MDSADQRIGALKKVTLSLEAGRSPEAMDLTNQPLLFEFIFGLGTAGLTPFELELVDKTVGDKVCLCIKREEMPRLFEHLPVPHFGGPADSDPFYLKGLVLQVTPADQRELIKALAEIANCGEQCCG